MGNYSNILCVSDFSIYSNEAFLRGVDIARTSNSEVTLLHIVEYFPEDRSNESIAPENTDPEKYRAQQANRLLSEQLKLTDYTNIKQQVLFSTHSARHEILRYAKENNVDLVVVASHGHHGVGGLLGSTSGAIAHHSPCDLLIVRAK